MNGGWVKLSIPALNLLPVALYIWKDIKDPVMTIDIPDDLYYRLEQEANGLSTTIGQRLKDLLDQRVAPSANFDPDFIQNGLEKIRDLLRSIPGIGHVGISEPGTAYWWLKFDIDIKSKIAWQIVQELGHILNYLSVDDKLPTRFYPVSPPPYMNGGAEDFLSWVIEPSIPYVDPHHIYAFLNGRLPENYDKEESWLLDD